MSVMESEHRVSAQLFMSLSFAHSCWKQRNVTIRRFLNTILLLGILSHESIAIGLPPVFLFSEAEQPMHRRILKENQWNTSVYRPT